MNARPPDSVAFACEGRFGMERERPYRVCSKLPALTRGTT
jgi:hypothetical protein